MTIVPLLASGLAEVRADRLAWQGLAYRPVPDVDGHEADGNELSRAKVLWALQYDWHVEDAELARFLLDQETVSAQQAAFQGLSDELKLAGLLVARAKDPNDVWRQWEAKVANFDTWCGYPRQLLAAAGIETTLAFVRASAHPDREKALEDLAELGADEAEVAEVLRDLQGQYPSDPADEYPMTWMERYARLGDNQTARHYLEQWLAEVPLSRSSANSHQFHLAQLGFFQDAVRAQQQVIELSETAFDRAGAWRRLAELQRLTGAESDALKALVSCEAALADVAGWREIGLGRFFVEEAFELAARAVDQQVGVAAFALGQRHGHDMPRLPLVVLETAARAAARTMPGIQPQWAARADAERARIAAAAADHAS